MLSERIGRYEVLGEIARGGMGVVVRARDPEQGDEVAIKLLTAGGGSGQAQKRRFAREVEAMTRLDHPNVVRIRGSGEHRGRPYLVMDMVPGQSLRMRLARSGVLRVGEAAELTVKLAAAVGHAHQQGLLHRDIKPANVILTHAGEPMLTDFGLTKDVDDSQSKLSKTGTHLGTPGFWPPEQARGDLPQIGPRSDIYGLGATLYAALTGLPPVEGQSLAEIAVATESRPPTPPSKHRPGLPAQLERICLRCLEKSPQDRYESAEALIADLDRFLSGELLTDAPPRRAGLPALAVALVLSGLGVAGAVWIIRAPGRGAAPPAERGSPAISPAEPTAEELAARQQEARDMNDLGKERADAQDWSGALEAYTRATELDPEYASAFKNRAIILSALQDWPASLEAFERAVALDPDGHRAYIGRGSARAALDDPAGAIADYERGLELLDDEDDPIVPHVHQMLRQAQAALSGAVAPEENPRIWLNLGLDRLAARDLDAAEAAFAEVLQLDPNYAEAYHHRGRVRVARGLTQLAIDDYLMARSLYALDDPRRDEVQRLLAEVE